MNSYMKMPYTNNQHWPAVNFVKGKVTIDEDGLPLGLIMWYNHSTYDNTIKTIKPFNKN